MKRSRVYDRAEGIIRKYGWTQRQGGSRQQGFCAMGALEDVYRGGFYPLELQHVIELDEVTIWNDSAARTKEEVQEALLVAASLALSEEHAQ